MLDYQNVDNAITDRLMEQGSVGVAESHLSNTQKVAGSTPAQNVPFFFIFMLKVIEIVELIDVFRSNEVFKPWSNDSNARKFLEKKSIRNNILPIHHKRHIGLQTIYRDESSQTDPYSPAYTVSNGERPEVFTLSDFTYSKSSPMCLQLIMIDG